MRFKGQGALEYLMTYGWALLIIVVVGAALYALGVLNPGTYTRTTCAGFGYFSYKDHQLKSDGNFSLVIINGNQQVDIVGITINDGTADRALDMAATPTLSPTEVHTLNGNNTALAGTADTPYTYDVEIEYNVAGGISGQKDSAKCSGKFV